ncbi:hypothetical protein ACF0H5_005386 [Mactra antiquata]
MERMVIHKENATSGHEPRDDHYRGKTTVTYFRFISILVVIVSIYYKELLQLCIDKSYEFALTTWVFNSVYFETFLATFCYGVITAVYPWLIDKFRCLDKYKIHPSVRYEEVTVLEILKMGILYMAPLMLLDTFLVKKYHGVDPSIWIDKRRTNIQTTRALPVIPPSTIGIVFQLFASFILYDALFFVIHLTLHKNIYLYKYVHRHHHDHEHVHCHVTNQLTITERITLILSANFALKVFNSHPLTRAIFVPIFIGILVDNHTGYDLPFGMHRMLPFGLVGGSVKHFQHHMNGKRNYQPIFTYLDKLLEWYGTKKSL